jgi:uncharacterized membrane protein (DUF4010 family)
MDLLIAQQLLLSLGLGMLIGLQRERAHKAVGGIRTFPLITLLGTICGQLAQHYGGWIIAGAFVAVAALLFIVNLPRAQAGDGGGLTTEVAVLLLFALGAYLTVGPMWIVVVVGGVVALLLHWKTPLHRFAGAVGDKDMHAMMLFVLISMVILPVLPNKPFGPYGVFNPFDIWLMVVLIVGISLGGYVAYKIFGGKAGVLLSGILGGVISSTATTVSSARQSKQSTVAAGLVSLLIMVAATVSVLRVIIEIAVVASRSFPQLALPLGAMFAAMALISAGLFFFTRRDEARLSEQDNPAQLKAALIFAAIYALIKFAVAAGKEHFGTSGLYVVAVISGMTDMDAITLSTARLVDAQQVDASTGWRTILIAALANLAFKGTAVAVLGSRPLALRVAVLFALSGVAGGLILWLWP